jgi:hypothetical protein
MASEPFLVDGEVIRAFSQFAALLELSAYVEPGWVIRRACPGRTAVPG